MDEEIKNIHYNSHVTRVADHVKSKLPNAKIIIWDDMLHNIHLGTLNSFVYF